MKGSSTIQPIFVDGIEMLHIQLASALHESYDLVSKYIQIAPSQQTQANEAQRKPIEPRLFYIFVDFSEQQPENAIKGYGIYRGRICRFINITIDYATLFPVYDHSSSWFSDMNHVGVTFTEIQEMKKSQAQIVLCVVKHRTDTLFFIDSRDRGYTNIGLLKTRDDLGKTFCSFPDIASLKVMDIPHSFSSVTYTLVGIKYYAPLTTNEEFYCVLFAQMDNELDENAIKVLRWLPQKRAIPEAADAAESHFGDIFFELGYVSRDENKKLHNFMVEKSNRLLFGKVKENKITLLGGIKMFFDNDFAYPACLMKIPII